MKEAIIESLNLIPFLFVTYLFMELLEHKAGYKTKRMVQKTGKAGPILGGILGTFPQCGFSAAASNLYAGKVITLGTLISIYLSTSDEMLPILVSEAVSATTIIKILVAKVVIGMTTGFLIEFVSTFILKHKEGPLDEIDACDDEHCGCDHHHNIFKSAFVHTLKIFVFIAIVSVILHEVLGHEGHHMLENILVDTPLVGNCIAALVGLIPNCAGSVVITQLYLEGILGPGAMMSGLLVSAGVGILVLFRTNNNMKKNFGIVALLYASGVCWGVIIELLGITF